MLGFAGILLAMFDRCDAAHTGHLPLCHSLWRKSEAAIYTLGFFKLYAGVSCYDFSPVFKIGGYDWQKEIFYPGHEHICHGELIWGVCSRHDPLNCSKGGPGLGSRDITPIALAMITDMFPAEKRGNMIGIFGFVQLLSNLLSPSLGSFITKSLGWHWIFFLNLGMVVLSCLLLQ